MKDEYFLFLIFLIALCLEGWWGGTHDHYQGCGDMDRSAKCLTWGAIR